jgi:hypothetical protein
MRGPAPPGSSDTERGFLVLHTSASESDSIICVHDWSSSVAAATVSEDVITLELHDGETHVHELRGPEWQLHSSGANEPMLVMNIGSDPSRVALPSSGPSRTRGKSAQGTPVDLIIPARRRDQQHAADVAIDLGEHNFRRSELDWAAHGKPTAQVRFSADDEQLYISVDVAVGAVNAAPRREAPYLDNENPDVNSDGVQIHFGNPNAESQQPGAAFLLVPEPGGVLRATQGSSFSSALAKAEWSTTAAGWRVALAVTRDALPDRGSSPFLIDVIVNLLKPGRERRSGQLVLSGARGEWIYLLGDRQPASRMLRARIDA